MRIIMRYNIVHSFFVLGGQKEDMFMEKMREIPESERPYEKVLRYGAGGLSDAELLAVILRTGSKKANSVETARQILKLHPVHKKLTALYHLTLQQLMSIEGIGEVKAIQVLCIAELSKRISRCRSEELLSLTSPQSIADYYMEELRHLEREELRAMFFDNQCRMICDVKLAEGTVNCAVSTPREICSTGLKCGACSMVLVHNHPSGNINPSKQDLLFTSQVASAAEMIGIPLSDHIIIGNQDYFSMKERGFM